MRKFKYIESFEKIKEAFSFLINEYNFNLIRSEELNYGVVLEYCYKELKVYIFCDYMENQLGCFLIRGSKTSEFDNKSGNVKWFYDLFLTYEPLLEFKSFQPDDDDYEPALYRNVTFLKEYGDKILRGGGDVWF